jgi:Colicin E5 ribonuclease domain
MEGKWFATQGEHAEQWGQLLNNGEGVTVETRIPQSVADQLYFESGSLLASGLRTYLHHWVAANKISKDEHLKTPGGATVTVVGGTTPKQHDGLMWDLTVPGNNDHDFYVAVAATAVVVHNCGPDLDNLSPKIVRQMEQRGWTSDQIQDAYDNGEQVNAVNRATGGTATRYINPVSGQSVVIEDATVIHVGGPGFLYGPDSGDLP